MVYYQRRSHEEFDSLEAARPETPTDPTRLQDEPCETQTRILIVDDFEEDQAELTALIQETGGAYSIEAVKTGQEAVEVFEMRQYDCVFVDYRLQCETGLDLLKRLKTIDPFCAAV